MINSSGLLQLKVKESQLTSAYENKRNSVVHVALAPRGASDFRHGCSQELRWFHLDFFSSMCSSLSILQMGIWSERWPPATWDCHLPSLAIPSEREFAGISNPLSQRRSERLSLTPHVIIMGSQGMGSGGPT